MPRPCNIAVIAKEPALQQSLAFALGADGYQVEIFDSWLQAEDRLDDMICIIVDHDAIQGDAAARKAMLDQALRIVLLTDQTDLPCSAHTQILTKPLTGSDVIGAAGKFRDAVSDACLKQSEGF